ncbi:hypothetical protein GCM10023191_039620 [Actinoallomurus oryzae]|uniref:Bulb-type lectin domain-containing protein n=1 Tax=Actinoallomurus oryzae TaxID=502180 RepID=A0ABP8Q5Z2_9ACTN
MSAESGPGERAESLGVRRPVELPETDMDAADGLIPAEPESQPDSEPGSEPSESAAAATAAVDDAKAPADSAAPDKKDDRAAVAEDIAAATQPGALDGDEMPPDRPNKPLLAGVAIGGAVVLAVPILLIGTGSDHAKKHPTAAAAETVLPGAGQPPTGAFVSSTPTPSPSAKKEDKAKAKKKATPSATPSPTAHARRKTVSPQMPSSSAPSSRVIHAPRNLYPGDTVRTNRIALTMQAGGNLVLRDKSKKIIWSTRTHKPGVYATFQRDGNLVLYDAGRKAVWAAGSFGHDNSTLVLQSDYNMVIVDHDGHPVWATGTNR